jgi:hypothetical protein
LLTAGLVVGIVFHRRLSNDHIPIILAMVAWSLALILLTRNVAFARVWLFFLPLFIIVSSAGLFLLVQTLTRRVMRPEPAVALLALLLAGGTAINVIRTRVIVDANFGDTATLRDAPEIALAMKTLLRDRDKVLTAIPADAPLEYYLNFNSVPHSYLAWPPMRPTEKPVIAGSERLLIVVDEGRGQTLESVLHENMIDRADYGPATPLQRYTFGSVIYALNRIQESGGK